jgi:5-hydroxyisourate hydrolase-like protein (transthyretin family)
MEKRHRPSRGNRLRVLPGFPKEVNRPGTRRVLQLISSSIFLLICSAAVLQAEGHVQGQILNGTTGKPVPNQIVQLLLPRGGMQQVAAVTTDAEGRFVFPPANNDPGAFYLAQAVFEGVNYHAPVQFDSNGLATINIKVFDSTHSAPPLRIKSARLLMRAQGDKVRVQEMFAVENSTNPPRSYVNTDGTFHFKLSTQAGEPRAAVAGLMNMPLPQPVNPGKSPGDYSIQYPLKPGLTVVLVVYETDYRDNRFALGDSVPYPIDSMDVLVTPSSLSLESRLFRPSGPDSESGSQRYAAEHLKAGTTLEALLSGEATPTAGPSENAQGESEVKILPNPTTRLGVPLLLCFVLLLLWALGVRVAREWPKWKEQRGGGTVHKELEARVDALFNSLADLDEIFAAGKIAEKQYWKERLELKARLVAALKKAPASLLESYAIRHTSSR